MLPLHSHTGAASMLVQSSGLLDALVALFEAIWDQAYPLLSNISGDGVLERRAELDELDSHILALLLTGMTDEAVAGQLGTSRRTVQRRIHQLMVKAGADTRIELGWYAARKGWA
jgi:DNA-binding NarL/FixJ family response regulator